MSGTPLELGGLPGLFDYLLIQGMIDAGGVGKKGEEAVLRTLASIYQVDFDKLASHWGSQQRPVDFSEREHYVLDFCSFVF